MYVYFWDLNSEFDKQVFLMLGNVVSLGVILFVACDSFPDVDLEDKHNVVSGPQQTQDTARDDYDPFISKCQRRATSIIENFGQMVESMVKFQHRSFLYLNKLWGFIIFIK